MNSLGRWLIILWFITSKYEEWELIGAWAVIGLNTVPPATYNVVPSFFFFVLFCLFVCLFFCFNFPGILYQFSFQFCNARESITDNFKRTLI